MAAIGATQMDPTKKAAIAEKVQRELKAKAILGGTVFDVSKFAQPGVKQVSFPKFGSFTVENRASATAGTPQVISSTVDTLDLNYKAYLSWIIDSNDALQSAVTWQAELAMRAASAHARYVDSAILAELGNVAQVATGVTSLSTKADVVALRKLMVDNHVNPADCYLVASSDEYANILNQSDFVSADKMGAAALVTGVVGKILSLNVVEHPGLGSGFFVYHPEGIALGFQAAPNMATQPDLDYGSTAEKTVMDQLFGVKGLQIAQNGAASGKSALVYKNATV